MNITIINPLLYTPPIKGEAVPRVATIKHTMIYYFAMAFVKLGHKVTIIASEEYRPTESETYDCNIVFLKNIAKQIYKKWPNGLPILSGLTRYLWKNRAKIDLIISSEILTPTTLSAAIVAPHKLVIWQEFGKHMQPLKEVPSKIWYNVVVPLFMRKTIVIPRSEKALSFASKYAKCVSQEIVDHGIDTDNFRPSNEKENYFVVVARLERRKRIDLTIRKFAEFCEMYSDKYRLILLGDGAERERLEALVAELNLKDRVCFYGFQDREALAKIVSRARASLIDTIADLNMVSIAETVTCGTPIITNTVPYSIYYIRKNNLGIVDQEWDYRAMIDVLENNDKYVANCINYRPKLAHTYLAERMIEIYKKHYEDITDK
uniref:glycosyltransferase n=1 Tax=Alistipes sp. TaxID=1872444 RepID=UPI0040572DA6